MRRTTWGRQTWPPHSFRPRPSLRPVGPLLLALALGAGCAARRPAAGPAPSEAPAPAGPPGRPTPIVTPGSVLRGRVVSLNPSGRFVVVSFALGAMPAPEQRLGVYRARVRVGELQATRWQHDNLAVADIVAGDCQVGDEVRTE